jgi:hypothetical protein
METLSSVLRGLLAIVIVAAAFTYVIRPTTAAKLLKTAAPALLAALGFFWVLSVWFGNAAGWIVVLLFAVASITANWLRRLRKPGIPPTISGGERKPILPRPFSARDEDGMDI